MGFDKDGFIADCRAALEESDVEAAIEAVVRRAVSDPAGVIAALGEPREATFDALYAAPATFPGLMTFRR